MDFSMLHHTCNIQNIIKNTGNQLPHWSSRVTTYSWSVWTAKFWIREFAKRIHNTMKVIKRKCTLREIPHQLLTGLLGQVLSLRSSSWHRTQQSRWSSLRRSRNWSLVALQCNEVSNTDWDLRCTIYNRSVSQERIRLLIWNTTHILIVVLLVLRSMQNMRILRGIDETCKCISERCDNKQMIKCVKSLDVTWTVESGSLKGMEPHN